MPAAVVALAAALAAAMTIAMTDHATATSPATTTLAGALPGIHPLARAATPPSNPQPVASPIPPARDGRAGHEVTALVWVQPPTAPGCGHMRDLTGAAFRLLGAWAQTVPETVPVPTTGQLWWLTGHTLPPVEAADHTIEAPFIPGCDHEPAFYVDQAINLADWLSDLVRALLAGPFHGLAPRPTTPGRNAPAWL